MQVIVPVETIESTTSSTTTATNTEVVVVDVTQNQKKAMKRLTCRKCEGHGFYAILKGHAGVCPYKDCLCGTCGSVMSMRANALIRRFRHRQPEQSRAVVKTLRSKNGNLRLRIVPRSEEEMLVEPDGTLVTYTNDKNGQQTYTTTNRRSSIMTTTTDDRDSVISTPPTSTNNSTPSGSPPLLSPYGEMDLAVDQMAAVGLEQVTNLFKTTLLQQLLQNPTVLTPAILSLLLQPTPQTFEPANVTITPPVLFPSLMNGISAPSLSV